LQAFILASNAGFIHHFAYKKWV